MPLKFAKLKYQTLGAYLLVKALIPLAFVGLLCFTIFRSYQLIEATRERIVVVARKEAEIYEVRILEIEASLKAIATNFENAQNILIPDITEITNTAIESAESIETLANQSAKDFKVLAGGIREGVESTVKETKELAIAIRATMEKHRDAVKERLDAVNVYLREIEQFGDDLNSFLVPLRDAVNFIADAVDWILPADISLPPIPSLPKMPNLGISELVKQMQFDASNIKNRIKVLYEQYDTLVKDSQNNLSETIKPYREKLGQIQAAVNGLSNLESFELDPDIFIEPTMNVIEQTVEMKNQVPITYWDLSRAMSPHQGASYTKELNIHKERLRLLVYILAVWFGFLLIDYLINLKKNLTKALHLIRRGELPNEKIY